MLAVAARAEQPTFLGLRVDVLASNLSTSVVETIGQEELVAIAV